MVTTQADLLARGTITIAELGEWRCPHCAEPLWADDDREDQGIIDCPRCEETYRRDEAAWVPDYPDAEETS